MVLAELKCGKCNHRFLAETLDRDDPRERHEHGSPMRCQNCGSTLLEVVRIIRRVPRRVS